MSATESLSDSPNLDLRPVKKKNKILPKDAYKVLLDIVKEQMDIIWLCDRKARFALIIVGAFNVILFFSVNYLDSFVASLEGWQQVALAVIVVFYGCVLINFFILAIRAIQPTDIKHDKANLPDSRHYSPIRSFNGVIRRTPDEFWEIVRTLNYEKINRELSDEIHFISNSIQIKYQSLSRLYNRMKIMTASALFVIVLAFLFEFTDRVRGIHEGEPLTHASLAAAFKEAARALTHSK